MAVKSFTVYKEYDDLVEFLDTENEKEQLVYAFWKYMFHDDEPDNLNHKQMAIFNNLKRPLEKSKSKSKNKLNKIKTKSNENQNKIKNKSKNNQNKNTSDVNVVVNVNVNNIIKFIEDNFNRTISSYELEQIELLVNKYSNEVVLYAFQKTLESDKRSLNYTKGILKNWEQDNLKTLDEIKKSEIKPKSNHKETIDEKFERLKREGRI